MACLRCHPPDEREAGDLKMCLQYFQSVRQLRLSLYNVKYLCVENQKVMIKVSAGSGRKKINCSSKSVQGNFYTAVFNENLYLMLRKELGDYNLRIRLIVTRKKRCFSCFSKSTTIGQASMSLDELNLDMDTALEIKLKTKGRQTKNSFVKDIKIYRDDTIEDHLRKARSTIAPNQLPSRHHRSPDVIRSLSVFKEFTEVNTECYVNTDNGNGGSRRRVAPTSS